MPSSLGFTGCWKFWQVWSNTSTSFSQLSFQLQVHLVKIQVVQLSLRHLVLFITSIYGEVVIQNQVTGHVGTYNSCFLNVIARQASLARYVVAGYRRLICRRVAWPKGFFLFSMYICICCYWQLYDLYRFSIR